MNSLALILLLVLFYVEKNIEFYIPFIIIIIFGFSKFMHMVRRWIFSSVHFFINVDMFIGSEIQSIKSLVH